MDLETEVEKEIGRIKLDNQGEYEGYGLLTGLATGSFQYRVGNVGCLEAEYGKIIRIGPVADDVWLPSEAVYTNTKCISAIRYSPQDGVIIEEVGEGVVRDPEEPIENVTLWEYGSDISLDTLPELQSLFE